MADELKVSDVLEEVKKVGGNIEGVTQKVNTAIEDIKKADGKAEGAVRSIEDIKKLMDANDATIKKLTADLEKTIQVTDKLQVTKGGGGQPEAWKPFSFYIGDALTKAKDKITKAGPTGKFQLDIDGKCLEDMRNVWQYRASKAVGDMTVAASVTGAIPITYRQEIVSLPFELVHLRNLVPVVPSDTDAYHFYQAKMGEGAVAFQTDENAQKAQLDDDLVEQTVNLNYLAGWERISRKMLRNFSGLRDWISRWLPERYYKAEDAAGVAALVAGIPAGNTNTVTADTAIDGLVAAIAAQKTAGYNVNAIVTTGAIWGGLITNKDVGGIYTLPSVVVVSPTGQIMFLGIPVYTASWVPADTIILGDWNYFNIVQSEALSVTWSDEDRDNFVVNKVTVKVEACIGFALLQPAAFYKLTVTPVGP